MHEIGPFAGMRGGKAGLRGFLLGILLSFCAFRTVERRGECSEICSTEGKLGAPWQVMFRKRPRKWRFLSSND